MDQFVKINKIDFFCDSVTKGYLLKYGYTLNGRVFFIKTKLNKLSFSVWEKLQKYDNLLDNPVKLDYKDYDDICKKLLEDPIFPKNENCRNSFSPTDNFLLEQEKYLKKILSNLVYKQVLFWTIRDGAWINHLIQQNKLTFDQTIKVKILDNLIKNSPPVDKDIKVFRGLSTDIYFFKYPGFMSTSLFYEIAHNKGWVILEILIPKGAHCLSIFLLNTIFGGEWEILLPLNVKFTPGILNLEQPTRLQMEMKKN